MLVWNKDQSFLLLWTLDLFLSCRLVTNKLLLGVIILMELAILGAVIYLKFFRK